MQDTRVIIDTDPGVDDALAIAFGIKASLPIESICTVYGNSTVDNCTSNVLTILELANGNIPVYRGADKPMKGKNRLAQSHGNNGLGGFSIKTSKTISKPTALEHYKEILSCPENGDVSIIAIGPTTNIGQLVEQAPELFEKIGKIIIMGGVFGEKGNVSQYAEFNVYNDPYALKQILESGHHQIIIVPANICRQVTFTREVFDQINNPELASGLAKISQVYIDYYSNDTEFGGFKGGVMYDLLAVSLVVNLNLFRLEKARVRVEIEDEEKYGLTEIIEGEPNCQIITQVDVEKLKQLYVEVMNK